MQDTGYQDGWSDAALLYDDRFDTTAAQYYPLPISDGTGGLYSSAEDLFLWDQALYTDRLLPQAELQRMFEPHVRDTGDPQGFSYGYGMGLWEDSGPACRISQRGGPAFVTLIIRYPEDRLAAIMLTNQGGIDVSIWLTMSNELFGEPPPTSAEKVGP